ncbi:pyridoxal-phosphate-dependent aminotransferase family protein [Methanococcus maripaludis]|jgi:aspartate aminotransferase-like enzyme|uniref:Aspartate aminotransferase-like enzyme n=1 Tax=Methanococcus maripaludis TaxID=39152 RepID=A0A7J9S365_METMI|nr:alanine--glyoxylate aminotransferase family protein [Methanococcus maripaludis]MBA2851467.1 aspartate aminotransferase-like enzyme [Methanococcus maripaludis]MBB6067978.1 aspartate aminotransferase-like enzyme [Methanococcus maripaludis]MBM7410118.1 aspartate aminotransferase-like enzyme [Methanococcus maripaludis]MBP2219448.1 aspartate aminotransferase-like enzyme [Methanococcus maripaludis]
MKQMDTEKLLMIPGPTMVPSRVLNTMALPIIGHRTSDFGDLTGDTVDMMKKVFQTENDTYIITGSGTAVMDMAISNTLDKGDKVINITNGNFGERFYKISSVYKADTIKYEPEWGDLADPKKLRELLEENEGIKAVTVVHNETSTGAKNPIEDLGKVVKDFDAIYIVDTISSLGGDYVNVDKFNIDICVTGSQKCIAAPPGLAAITVGEKAWDVVSKTETKSFYLDLNAYKKSWDAKKETPYTPSVSLTYAMNEALEMVLEEGLENRFKRHDLLARATRAGLEAMGLELFAKERARSVTVTSAKYPEGIDDKKFRGLLAEKYNIRVAGGQSHLAGKIFRVGHMGSAKEYQVLGTLAAIELAFKELGYNAEGGVAAAKKVLSN